jgi:peptidyl-prolyl cis-trans isomerase SurA
MTYVENTGTRLGMRLIALLALFVLLTMPVSADDKPAAPAGVQIGGIIATVNDDVITATDLNDRLRLAFFTSNLPETEDNKKRLLPQVLRGLIDESLQRQEAAKLGITVADDEIKTAAARLAADNKLPADQLEDFLKSRGVPIRTLKNQIEAAMLWGKVIQRRLRPLVEVGDEEVQARMDRYRANAGKTEYLVAEIFLRVDDSANEAQVENVASSLVTQIEGGANFAAVAQQFSQGAGALQGGDLGWVTQGQLPRELDGALADLGGRGLTRPIRSPSGYHILLVRDTRQSAGVDPASLKVTLGQVFIPASDTLDDDVAQARRAVKGCKTLTADMQRVKGAIKVKDLGARNMGELPDWLATLVQSLGEGETSEPYAVDGGALLVVLCQRDVPGEVGITREQVTQQIGTERLELQARRLLRDIRTEAVVESRLQ